MRSAIAIVTFIHLLGTLIVVITVFLGLFLQSRAFCASSVVQLTTEALFVAEKALRL
jgi:hypothetical protein